jgi:hypothetical protein
MAEAQGRKQGNIKESTENQTRAGDGSEQGGGEVGERGQNAYGTAMNSNGEDCGSRKGQGLSFAPMRRAMPITHPHGGVEWAVVG